MKRLLILLTSLLLLAALAGTALPAARAGSGPSGVTAQVVSPPSTGLTVVGTGVVAVQPDRAYLSVGVQSVAASALTAQEGANRTMSRVMAALTALPVVKNVRTASLALSPRYAQNGPAEPSQPTGFQADQVLALTVVDVGKAGLVLDAALQAGANAQMGVSFGRSDTTAAQRQALAAAVADGRRQADAARAAGQRLRRLTALVVLPASQAGAWAEAWTGRAERRPSCCRARSRSRRPCR